MRDFNRSNKFSRGRSFGNRPSFGNRGTDRPALHKAICDKCKIECEVPFAPTSGKPVFCRDCFRATGGTSLPRPEGRNFSRPSFSNTSGSAQYPQFKEQFEALNIKLDKILKILSPIIFEEETPIAQEEKQISTPEKKKRVSKKASTTPKK